MAFALEWDKTGEHLYETGVDRGVLFVQKKDATYNKGVAWNGLTSIDESPSGGDANDIYADNIKYLSLRAAEDYGFTINAYTYPKEFGLCNGEAQITPGVVVGQQSRRAFGMSYRSRVGNDIVGDSYGYKLHLIWNATVNPSDKTYETVNDSPDAIEFSWEAETIPVDAGTYTDEDGNEVELKKAASITIDTTRLKDGTANEKLKELEEKIYGTSGTGGSEPTFPTLKEVVEMFKDEEEQSEP